MLAEHDSRNPQTHCSPSAAWPRAENRWVHLDWEITCRNVRGGQMSAWRTPPGEKLAGRSTGSTGHFLPLYSGGGLPLPSPPPGCSLTLPPGPHRLSFPPLLFALHLPHVSLGCGHFPRHRPSSKLLLWGCIQRFAVPGSVLHPGTCFPSLRPGPLAL